MKIVVPRVAGCLRQLTGCLLLEERVPTYRMCICLNCCREVAQKPERTGNEKGQANLARLLQFVHESTSGQSDKVMMQG